MLAPSTATLTPLTASAAATKMPSVPPATTTSHCTSCGPAAGAVWPGSVTTAGEAGGVVKASERRKDHARSAASSPCSGLPSTSCRKSRTRSDTSHSVCAVPAALSAAAPRRRPAGRASSGGARRAPRAACERGASTGRREAKGPASSGRPGARNADADCRHSASAPSRPAIPRLRATTAHSIAAYASEQTWK